MSWPCLRSKDFSSLSFAVAFRSMLCRRPMQVCLCSNHSMPTPLFRLCNWCKEKEALTFWRQLKMETQRVGMQNMGSAIQYMFEKYQRMLEHPGPTKCTKTTTENSYSRMQKTRNVKILKGEKNEGMLKYRERKIRRKENILPRVPKGLLFQSLFKLRIQKKNITNLSPETKPCWDHRSQQENTGSTTNPSEYAPRNGACQFMLVRIWVFSKIPPNKHLFFASSYLFCSCTIWHQIFKAHGNAEYETEKHKNYNESAGI